MFDYVEGPGRDTVCTLLIETIETVENIEAICAVPGVDCIVLAPFDLSTGLGVSGQIDHPKMKAASSKIEAAAHAAAMPLGGAALTLAGTEALMAGGYRMFGGFDILWLKAAIVESISWIRT